MYPASDREQGREGSGRLNSGLSSQDTTEIDLGSQARDAGPWQTLGWLGDKGSEDSKRVLPGGTTLPPLAYDAGSLRRNPDLGHPLTWAVPLLSTSCPQDQRSRAQILCRWRRCVCNEAGSHPDGRRGKSLVGSGPQSPQIRKSKASWGGPAAGKVKLPGARDSRRPAMARGDMDQVPALCLRCWESRPSLPISSAVRWGAGPWQGSKGSHGGPRFPSLGKRPVPP